MKTTAAGVSRRLLVRGGGCSYAQPIDSALISSYIEVPRMNEAVILFIQIKRKVA